MPEKETKKQVNLDLKLIKNLFPYLNKYKKIIFLSMVILILINVLSVLQPYLIKVGIDKNIMQNDYSGLKNTVLILFFVITIGFGFNFFFNYIVQLIGQKILLDLRMDIFRRVLKLSNAYFDKTPVGKTLTNITSDVEAIRGFISEGVITVLGELLKVVFILIAMVIINYQLAILTLLSIPFFIIGTMLFRSSIRKGYDGVRKANSEINISLVETTTGIKEILLFDHKKRSDEKFDRSNKDYKKAYLKVIFAYSLYFPIIEVVSNISMMIVFYYAHILIGTSLGVGEIFAFFFYINMFFRPLRELAEKFNMFQSAMAAAERIFKLMDRKIEIEGGWDIIPDNGSEFENMIEFRNISFEYKRGVPVLKNVSFSIKKGEKIAIVGNTGSGKTTIINLINRLYDVGSGQILLNGTDIRELSLVELRKKIGVVPQDPFMFTGTIAENISLFDHKLDSNKIINAAIMVNADLFIKKFVEGYDENVLEEGKKLSSGQKQLISFARVIVRDPSVIVLDEATSNIDSETELYIEKATRKVMKERTAIIIAHRLSTIKMVDRIIVLNKGVIEETGDHSGLIKKRGLYYNLYKTQAFLQE